MRFWGLRYRVQSFVFSAWSSGFKVWSLEPKVEIVGLGRKLPKHTTTVYVDWMWRGVLGPFMRSIASRRFRRLLEEILKIVGLKGKGLGFGVLAFGCNA